MSAPLFRLLSAPVLAASLAWAASAGAAPAADARSAAAIQAAIYENNYWRTDAEKARDPARRPEEVLTFLDVRPNMTVVENNPGAGWYSHILGPLLKDRGTYHAARPAPELLVSTVPADRQERFVTGLRNWQARFGEANSRLAGPQARAFFYGAAPSSPAYLPSGSVDVVLDIHGIHNLVSGGSERTDTVFAEFFRVVKPGGVLGVVDHRENEASARTPAESAAKGYVKESYLIALAEKAGFKLAGRSDVLSNPRDTKDYENGVWTLPPVYALGDKDRAKYAAIGESDRMLLKFVKPAK